MLNVAMTHFQAHIAGKADPCSLSLVDLLHVSNFKGGNASITEPEPGLARKLRGYERVLHAIAAAFGGQALRELNAQERATLVTLAGGFLALTQTEATKIRGLGPSYASALLAAHFPELLPVLDRRVLNGAGIAVRVDSQGQVRDLPSHYPALIEAFHESLVANRDLTVRELDRIWFCRPLPGRGHQAPAIPFDTYILRPDADGNG
jgi:hypothetical protein